MEAAISGASGTAVNFSRPRDGALGGIQDTLGLHRGEVASATVVPLGTLGIRDLLQQHGVPQHIHYLSLDVEGEWRRRRQPRNEVALGLGVEACTRYWGCRLA